MAPSPSAAFVLASNAPYLNASLQEQGGWGHPPLMILHFKRKKTAPVVRGKPAETLPAYNLAGFPLFGMGSPPQQHEDGEVSEGDPDVTHCGEQASAIRRVSVSKLHSDFLLGPNAFVWCAGDP